jgi:hypothetical protein
VVILLFLQAFCAFRAQRLAASLAIMPAIFEDGLPLPEKLSSGLYSDLIWRYKAVPHEEVRLRPPPYSVASLILSTAASFFAVPLILFAVLVEVLLRKPFFWAQVGLFFAFLISALAAVYFMYRFAVEISLEIEWDGN